MGEEPLVVETDFDVRYAETDAMGIVHHSAYVIWFEEGRSAWFRECLADPRGYALIEDDGYYFAVTDVNARYVAPARYGDRIRVRTWITALRSRGLTVAYRVGNAATKQLLAKGRTTHICLDKEGHVSAIPAQWAGQLRR